MKGAIEIMIILIAIIFIGFLTWIVIANQDYSNLREENCTLKNGILIGEVCVDNKIIR